MWDLIVSVPDHCLSFYFVVMSDLGGRNASRLESAAEEILIIIGTSVFHSALFSVYMNLHMVHFFLAMSN